MTARIEQIIEVIEEVRDNFRTNKKISSINRIRVAAGHSVAARRNITYQSVIDKFVRQLRPHVNTAVDFDDLLEEWLLNGSNKLKNVILKFANDKDDEFLINNAFYVGSEKDILLSEEFGLTPNDVEFIEGKEKLKIHLIKERNQHLVRIAKALWANQNHGNVVCSICSFSFYQVYGELGKDYIEAHHLVPLSELSSTVISKVDDLAPVCSNCHRMIHRQRPWISTLELKNIVQK